MHRDGCLQVHVLWGMVLLFCAGIRGDMSLMPSQPTTSSVRHETTQMRTATPPKGTTTQITSQPTTSYIRHKTTQMGTATMPQGSTTQITSQPTTSYIRHKTTQMGTATMPQGSTTQITSQPTTSSVRHKTTQMGTATMPKGTTSQITSTTNCDFSDVIVIGLSCGLFVLLVVCFILIVVIWKLNRRLKGLRESNSGEDSQEIYELVETPKKIRHAKNMKTSVKKLFGGMPKSKSAPSNDESASTTPPRSAATPSTKLSEIPMRTKRPSSTKARKDSGTKETRQRECSKKMNKIESSTTSERKEENESTTTRNEDSVGVTNSAFTHDENAGEVLSSSEVYEKPDHADESKQNGGRQKNDDHDERPGEEKNDGSDNESDGDTDDVNEETVSNKSSATPRDESSECSADEIGGEQGDGYGIYEEVKNVFNTLKTK